MLTKLDIQLIAQARLKDAEVLFEAKRYEGAVYLCGYVVELGLKYKICKTLNWDGYPLTRNQFKNYSSFKTHKLDVLLHLSGAEENIKSKFLAEWSVVSEWDPEDRYQPIGNIKEEDAKLMLESVTTISGEL